MVDVPSTGQAQMRYLSTFLVLVALGGRTPGAVPDPVPHAMVITGIVVAVSATALALALVLRVCAKTGRVELPEEPGL